MHAMPAQKGFFVPIRQVRSQSPLPFAGIASQKGSINFYHMGIYADLVKIGNAKNKPLFAPELVAKGMTRLVFSMGTSAMDLAQERQSDIMEATIVMLRMILIGSEQMAQTKASQ